MIRLSKHILCLFVFLSLSASGPKRPVEVRVLSFSIHNGKDYWAESNLREVLKIIEKHNPHLIALQEIDSLYEGDKVSFHLRQLAIQTGYHFVYGASGTVEQGTYGVGVLSKWPLENTQKLTLPHSPNTDPRVMVCGLVSPVKGRYLRMCSARLEYGSAFDRSLQSAYINQVLSPSVQPVLLGLDMGARPGEQPYTYFEKNWVDAARGSYLATWTQGKPGDRIDYLMALKNADVRIKSYKVIRDQEKVSDHFPIVATFELW